MSPPRFEGKPFSELLSNIVDNRGKTCPTSPSGIALIATNCIKNDNLFPVHEKVRYVSEDDYENWFRGHPSPGDLILVTKGTPGCVCLVPPIVDFCIAQDMVAVRADSQKVDPMYLFAALRSTDVQAEIENLHVGSLIPHFKKGDFNKLVIPLPGRDLQEYIGEQYFTLSAKIDLLHRQNKTLESMAEAIWRKMFMEEADPGWKRGKLGDYGEIICGKTPSKKVLGYFGGQTIFIKIPDMHGKIFVMDTEDSLTEEGKKSQQNKTVPSKSICVSCIATVGLVAMNAFDCQTNQQINSIVPAKDFYRYFLFLLMRNMKDDLLARASGGTATDNLNTGDFSRIETSTPPDFVIREFHDLVEDFFSKIYGNQVQIRTLSRLRDTLLPKLMSGEVRVKV